MATMMNPIPATPAGAPATPAGVEAEAPEADMDHPAYQAAMTLAMKALYRSGAAENVAKALRAAPDKVEALANTAYEMVSVVDERTQGQVPDELLVSLAAQILGEVADIASAAGVQVGSAEVAGAMQQMLLRYVTEQGLDPSQLREAMSQVDPAQLGAALEQAGQTANPTPTQPTQPTKPMEAA